MHVEFEPYHRSEILHGHLHLGGSNPGGERIEVNSLCLTRGGQPWLPVMGEFHFSRCDPAQWQTELCKMKAGGVTMVSTYLFWIHHEEREGELRFSGRLDVRRFVLCCRRAGLDVVLRIGPWAHGECRNGGFPDWLLHKGIPLRQNHPAYLALVRAWYRSIYRQVRGLLYRDGGPIVGIQLENELVDNSDHLAALKRIAVEEGFEVPLYTVTGWNAVSGARIPTAEVLPEIVDAVGGKMTILVDGGIRSGMDIFKALALGADAVLIGRPFVTAVYGGEEEGVQLYVQKLKAELADTMRMCGAHSLAEIKRSMLFGF